MITALYMMRSRRWSLSFQDSAQAGKAAETLRNANDKLHFLSTASPVSAHGKEITITWKGELRGKNVVDYLYKHCPKEFGSHGKFWPWTFKNAPPQDPLLQSMEDSAIAQPSSTSAVDGASAQPQEGSSYISLPQQYALDASQWYTRESHGGLVALSLLRKEGFVLLRKFLPEYMYTPARNDAEAHFLEVLRSFTHGHAIESIDEVHKLNGKVWETSGGKSFNPYAAKQKWGCITSRGYQKQLGMGNALSEKVFQQYPSVMACQHYMRHYLALLHNCSPEALCWRPDGVSIKGRCSEHAPPHRDAGDHGRYQCVLALAAGAFDVWPGSHVLEMRGHDHFHLSQDDLSHLRANSQQLIFACDPGDVLIFIGGMFIHGSPSVGAGDPSPRIMTYATFWPPDTAKGADHLEGRCNCRLPYEALRAIKNNENNVSLQRKKKNTFSIAISRYHAGQTNHQAEALETGEARPRSFRDRCSEHAGAQLGASEHVHEARLALQSNDLRPQALWAAHI